jgi:hypothetical protein
MVARRLNDIEGKGIWQRRLYDIGGKGTGRLDDIEGKGKWWRTGWMA